MKGAPGGVRGHTWGERRHAAAPPSFVRCAVEGCDRPVREHPADGGRFLVPGETVWRCDGGHEQHSRP